MKALRHTLLAFFLVSSCADTRQHNDTDAGKLEAPQTIDTLIGSYEFSSGDGPSGVEISVTVSHDGGDYVLGFLAAHPDGHGAAPDGSGVGRVGNDGVLSFAYEDSFSNRGVGTFQRAGLDYALSIHIDHVQDSRCMMFYGDFTLQRVKPESPRSQ